jgi:hypothetical protein
MVSFQHYAAAGLIFCVGACSSANGEPKTATSGPPGVFTYAPALNARHHETMRREEQVSIPGTPMRNSERWTLDWDVVTSRESDMFKRSLTLVGLKINVNGVDALRGDEVKASNATVDVLTDKNGGVVAVRGTEQLSDAIARLGTPEVQPALRRMFSPQRLKALVAMRSMEQNADFVGRPTRVGSQWKAKDPETGQSRQMQVVREERCDASQCLRVQREYDVDRKALFQEVSDQVASYVTTQGGDPSQVKVVNTDVTVEDSMLIDPATMDYHSARFNQSATITVAGPSGELPISLQLLRETDYKY